MRLLIKGERSVENTPKLGEDLEVYFTRVARSGGYLRLSIARK